MRERSLCFLLIAAISVQACLVEIPTARAIAIRSSVASDKSLAGSFVQTANAQTTLQRAGLLVNEIKATAYPELRDADVQVKLFKSESDYFRARFAMRQFLIGGRMRYLVFINASGTVVTKAERLANLKSGATSLDTIVTDPDMKIRVYGGDVAVAINRVTLKGQYSGKATSGQFQAGIVWAKTPAGWQLICNQITPVTSP